MGGNALKINKSIRLENDRYHKLIKRVVGSLQQLYPNGNIADIKSYANKPDHGDLDVLIYDSNYDPYKAAEHLQAVEVVRNGDVTSIGVLVDPNAPAKDNTFQVDLIKSTSAEYNYSYNYFNWNDIGNLLGRIAHKMGLSHGHEGLYYYFRDGDYKFREIVLTRDYSKALLFLGYDPEQYNKGFSSLDDIFSYVTSTQFFNSDIYLLHNRNAVSRMRDKKRPTYTAFLQYCQLTNNLTNFDFPTDKTYWHQRIQQFFPHFEHEYQLAEKDLSTQRLIKSKFNGDLVSEITGFKDKQLGIFISSFKNSIGDNYKFNQWVLSSTDDDIKAQISQFVSH